MWWWWLFSKKGCTEGTREGYLKRDGRCQPKAKAMYVPLTPFETNRNHPLGCLLASCLRAACKYEFLRHKLDRADSTRLNIDVELYKCSKDTIASDFTFVSCFQVCSLFLSGFVSAPDSADTCGTRLLSVLRKSRRWVFLPLKGLARTTFFSWPGIRGKGLRKDKIMPLTSLPILLLLHLSPF